MGEFEPRRRSGRDQRRANDHSRTASRKGQRRESFRKKRSVGITYQIRSAVDRARNSMLGRSQKLTPTVKSLDPQRREAPKWRFENRISYIPGYAAHAKTCREGSLARSRASIRACPKRGGGIGWRLMNPWPHSPTWKLCPE